MVGLLSIAVKLILHKYIHNQLSKTKICRYQIAEVEVGGHEGRHGHKGLPRGLVLVPLVPAEQSHFGKVEIGVICCLRVILSLRHGLFDEI
jgi:hypothetical protein